MLSAHRKILVILALSGTESEFFGEDWPLYILRIVYNAQEQLTMWHTNLLPINQG